MTKNVDYALITFRLPSKIFCSVLFILLMIASSLSYANQRVGQVLITKGVVSAVNEKNESRLLSKKSPIFIDDTIITAQNSFLVVRLVDKTKISLRPDSSLKIAELNQEEDKESAIIDLVKGGFRAVTGSIGKKKPEAFRVRTSVASIGIRGTDFTAELCVAGSDCLGREKSLIKKYTIEEYVEVLQGDLPEAINSQLPDGLYVYVTEGAVYIDYCELGNGEQCQQVEIDKDEAGFVREDRKVAGILKKVPLFLKQDSGHQFIELSDIQIDAIDVFFDDGGNDLICEFN